MAGSCFVSDLAQEVAMAGYLVLTRRSGEALMVGQTRIVVVDIQRGKVKLGICADQQQTILREELLAVRAAETPPARLPCRPPAEVI